MELVTCCESCCPQFVLDENDDYAPISNPTCIDDACPCHKPQSFVEEMRGRFDKEFGRRPDDPDDYSSIGESAGCDDCEANKRQRDEHWVFIEAELRAFSERVVPSEGEEAERLNTFKEGHKSGWNDAIAAMRERIEKELKAKE